MDLEQRVRDLERKLDLIFRPPTPYFEDDPDDIIACWACGTLHKRKDVKPESELRVESE